jgi:hypothetical protein
MFALLPRTLAAIARSISSVIVVAARRSKLTDTMSWPRPASPNPVGLWFCHISLGLLAKWQMSGGASEYDPQGARNRARDADTTRQVTTAPEPDAAGGTNDVVPVPVPPRSRRRP